MALGSRQLPYLRGSATQPIARTVSKPSFREQDLGLEVRRIERLDNLARDGNRACDTTD